MRKIGRKKAAKAAMSPAALRRVRESMHLSQRAFAKLLGVEPLTISMWERGVTPISEARALGIRAVVAVHGPASVAS